MTIYQGHAHREILCHANHGIVDCAVAMGVELAHHFADYSSALYVTFIGAKSHLGHLVENPSLHRLEPIAGIGQGARVNDGVGVLQEGALHLGRNIDIYNMADFVFHGPILTKSELNLWEGARLRVKWLGQRLRRLLGGNVEDQGFVTNG